MKRKTSKTLLSTPEIIKDRMYHEYNCTLLESSRAQRYYNLCINVVIIPGAEDKTIATATAYLIDNTKVHGINKNHHDWKYMKRTMRRLKNPVPVETMIAHIGTDGIYFEHTFLLRDDTLPFAMLISGLGINNMAYGGLDLSRQMELLIHKICFPFSDLDLYPYNITRHLYKTPEGKDTRELYANSTISRPSIALCMRAAFNDFDRMTINKWDISWVKEPYLCYVESDKDYYVKKLKTEA